MTSLQLLHELQLEMWDFYKDVHGVRPRYWTETEWNSVDFLQTQRAGLVRCLDAMSAGQKIAEGWGSDPQYSFQEFLGKAVGPARS